jgi:hypothetical protein
VAVVVAMVEADLLLPAVVVTVEADLPPAVVGLLLPPRVEVVSVAVGLPQVVVVTVDAGLPPAVVGLLLPRVEVVSLAVGSVQGQCSFGRRRWQGMSRARKKGPEETASSCCQAQECSWYTCSTDQLVS